MLAIGTPVVRSGDEDMIVAVERVSVPPEAVDISVVMLLNPSSDLGLSVGKESWIVVIDAISPPLQLSDAG